jgi:O-methyltransferase
MTWILNRFEKDCRKLSKGGLTLMWPPTSTHRISARPLVVKFLQTARLNKLAHKVYYNYLHGFNTATRALLPAIELCFNKALAFGTTDRGDYYEFGLFKGYAFWYAQNLVNKYNINKLRFFGFDSFKGMPNVAGCDKTRYEDFYEGQFACSKEKVITNLNSKGIDWKRAFLIEGFFEESLVEETKVRYEMNKVAIALIDCDLYASTVEVLRFIGDMVMDKTILIFDDWNCFNRDDARGQRRAFKEFLEKNKGFSAEELFSYGLHGQVFVMNVDKS